MPDRFLRARDFLLAHRTDYDAAYQGFEWPRVERFNWALDYFDLLAAGNSRTALWILEENGTETRLSFAELSERSSRRLLAFWKLLGVPLCSSQPTTASESPMPLLSV